MKNLLIVTGSLLFIFLLISTAVSNPQSSDGSVPNDSRSEVSAAISEVSAAPVAQNSLTTDTYIIKSYHQSVAVFKNSETTPMYVSDTHISTLPSAEQKALEKGIPISSEKELKKRLEDFCS